MSLFENVDLTERILTFLNPRICQTVFYRPDGPVMINGDAIMNVRLAHPTLRQVAGYWIRMLHVSRALQQWRINLTVKALEWKQNTCVKRFVHCLRNSPSFSSNAHPIIPIKAESMLEFNTRLGWGFDVHRDTEWLRDVFIAIQHDHLIDDTSPAWNTCMNLTLFWHQCVEKRLSSILLGTRSAVERFDTTCPVSIVRRLYESDLVHRQAVTVFEMSSSKCVRQMDLTLHLRHAPLRLAFFKGAWIKCAIENWSLDEAEMLFTWEAALEYGDMVTSNVCRA